MGQDLGFCVSFPCTYMGQGFPFEQVDELWIQMDAAARAPGGRSFPACLGF